MTRPTLVLVPGSWHSSAHFRPLVEDLESHKFKCLPVSLPSTQPPGAPPATLSDDTQVIRETVVHELEAGGNDVVVVAHSYGGAPSSNALEGLDAASRSTAGARTAVRKLIFISSLPVQKGVSIVNGCGPTELNLIAAEQEGFVVVGEPGPEHFFYSDLPSVEGKKWAELLQPMSFSAYLEEMSYAAHMDIPTAYLYCANDRAMTLAYQQNLVKVAKDAGAKIEVEETIEAGHSPFLSKVEETSAFIRKVASM
jgi:pimeloyl-ACP methyl ester carboxylesterase